MWYLFMGPKIPGGTPASEWWWTCQRIKLTLPCAKNEVYRIKCIVSGENRWDYNYWANKRQQVADCGVDSRQRFTPCHLLCLGETQQCLVQVPLSALMWARYRRADFTCYRLETARTTINISISSPFFMSQSELKQLPFIRLEFHRAMAYPLISI